MTRIRAAWDRYGAALMLAVITMVFLCLWGSVLTGTRTLIPGDILYVLAPFNRSPGAHQPVQSLTSDVILLMFPWFTLVREALLSGHLPLWNPYAFGGSPLLANGQSAPFSPFTLLAVPFPPAYGMSLMMLARFWVAGIGTYLYVRQLGAGRRAATISGLAFATCSYIVVWLGWPVSAVAALMPLGFAVVESYRDKGNPRMLAALALVLGLQFLAGHIETSIQFGGALALYAVVRVMATPKRRLRLLAGLAIAGGVALLLGAVALLPLFNELTRSGLTTSRTASHYGLEHLQPAGALSWLIPNRLGNPAIDGRVSGPDGNYNELTGFATVSALMLTPFGCYWMWRRSRSVALTLTGLALIAAGTVYGPLSAIIGRLPVFAVMRNIRLVVIICFVVAVMGGLGVQHLEDRQREHPGLLGAILAGVGALAAAGLAGMAYLLFTRRNIVDSMFPSMHYIGFWVIVAGLSIFGVAAALLAAEWRGASRAAVAALASIMVAEAAIFAGPYNPKVVPEDVPPRSAAMAQLRDVAGERPVVGIIAALPESMSLYRVYDESGYDAFVPARVAKYWSHADPLLVGYDQYVILHNPGIKWLAAAGVSYVMTQQDPALGASTQVSSTIEGVVLRAVPGARPFAYVAPAILRSNSVDESAQLLAADPMGPVVVEGCCQAKAGAVGGSAQGPVQPVALHRQEAGRVAGDVTMDHNGLVVVEQTYTPDWVARIDGNPAPVYPANVMLQAVEVPAGRHHVELSYEPASVSFGLALSGLGILGLLALMVPGLPAWRRWRQGKVSPEAAG